MDRLADEILAEIFEYLDLNTIKKLEKVCLRFKHIITTSPRTVRKFSLTSFENCVYAVDYHPSMENHDEQIKEQFDNLEAEMIKIPYRNIVIYFPESSKIPKKRYLEIAEKYFRGVEKFKFCQPDNFLVMKTLRLISSTLVELKIHPVNDDGIDQFKPIVLPRLKVFGTTVSTKILKVIQAENLKEMELEDCKDESESLENFFLTSKNLKVVNFKGDIPESFTNFKKFPFMLETVRINDGRSKKAQNYEQIPIKFFNNFLLPQRKSLKNLEIQLDHTDCKPFLALTIGILHLESLKCSRQFRIDRNSTIMDQMRENLTIKNLEIAFSAYDPQGTYMFGDFFNEMELKVIRKCKGIEKLIVGGILRDNELFLREISKINLKFLETDLFNVGEISTVKNESLETLSITGLSNTDDNLQGLVNFASSFPNIKKLIMGNFWLNTSGNTTKYFNEIFQNCQNLEEIEIKDFWDNIDELYDCLASQDCRINVLKLGISSIQFVKNVENKFKNVPYEIKIYPSKKRGLTEWDSFGMSYESFFYKDDDF